MPGCCQGRRRLPLAEPPLSHAIGCYRRTGVTQRLGRSDSVADGPAAQEKKRRVHLALTYLLRVIRRPCPWATAGREAALRYTKRWAKAAGFSDNAPDDRAGWLDCVDQINPLASVNDGCVEIVGGSRFGITGKLSGIRGELLLAPAPFLTESVRKDGKQVHRCNPNRGFHGRRSRAPRLNGIKPAASPVSVKGGGRALR